MTDVGRGQLKSRDEEVSPLNLLVFEMHATPALSPEKLSWQISRFGLERAQVSVSGEVVCNLLFGTGEKVAWALL